MKWFLYIVECVDRTLYTGIATDIEKRIQQHNSGKGSKYVRGKRPARLIYSEEFENRSQASKREFVIKQMSHTEKLKLVR